jgi:hypothetical protein
MPYVIALKKFRYQGHKYGVGEHIKVKGSHVDIMVRAGLVREWEPPTHNVEGHTYQTRHMEAARPGVVTTNARTVPELRAEAEARGIELPKGYIPKSELIRLLG